MTFDKYWLTRLQFSTAVRKNLYQSFMDYLKQGVPLVNIVHLLAESIIKANAKDQMFQVVILRDVEAQMTRGVEFAEAMSRWCPINEVMSIRAGMRSGDPISGMRNTIEALEASSEMLGTILSKLSYPAVLVSAMVGLIIFFSVVIIPKIAAVMDPALWPPVAKNLYNVANFVESFWWAILISLVALGMLVSWSLPRYVGRFRPFLDRFPPYSFYRVFHGANMLISIASLMRSGVPFVDSLQELQRLSSPYLKKHLGEMVQNMSEGKSLSESLDTGLLSGDTMVSVYMMSGSSNFQSAINEIGKISVRKGIATITKIALVINGAALLGVASYIGWVYYAFFSVSDAMARSVGSM
ncbi:type II secretory pathway component PulF [Pseudomonas nitritireducens]|uniref:Type II secretory pathway component PulF n=1 Tax=Pseudomonas nitroreducens TaxID=46680 RepID=A0A7W7KEK6_PSENT|nr:type II secretion system F family protein [Pseudomonas nitritireducens]MBB4861401.1 type II secretory pathway component PulF [Pseudomonas nitritireducens]